MSIRIVGDLSFVAFCIALAGCGDRVDKLIAQLGDPDPIQRQLAARDLGKHLPPDTRAAAALATAIADSDTNVQRAAITALEQIGPTAKSAVPALKKALGDPNLLIRRRAALVISRLDPAEKSFRPVLLAAMHEGDGRILMAVGSLGADAGWAVPTLIGLLSHREAKIRVLTASTLGRIGPAAGEAKPALDGLLRDPNAAVRAAAEKALDQLQERTADTNRR